MSKPPQVERTVVTKRAEDGSVEEFERFEVAALTREHIAPMMRGIASALPKWGQQFIQPLVDRLVALEQRVAVLQECTVQLQQIVVELEQLKDAAASGDKA